MKKSLLVVAIFGLAFLNTILAQTAVPGCIDGKIYLKYKKGVAVKYTNPADIDPNRLPGMTALIAKYGVNFAEKPFYQATDDDDLQRIYKVGFNNINDVDAFIHEIAANPSVEYAEKVPEMKTTYTPNDPSLGTQWHLATINAQAAWGIYNGNSTITVAVVDNAVMRTHPDLSANIWTNPGEIPSNGIDDDANGYVDDVNGYDVGDNDNIVLPPNTAWSHGTHCSGIVGARTDNTVGISAIGFNVKIIPVKAEANSGGSNSISNGFGGIIYAARCKAKVISCSWGGTVSAASDQSVINYAWSKGCIIIVSAGNDNNSVLHYPAAYNNVYSVASSNSSDQRSSFSCYGTWVDITSPGENIYSTIPNTSYGNMSGTSMACPLVAGLAGLMLSKNPYMSPTAVLNCISSSATNIYTIAANSPYAPNQLGAGRIDAFKAMQCASVAAGSPPSVDFTSDKQSTCPGNPIKFTDLSTLYPTTWSWTFQGGTPATSSVQNPTITYAAAGTYSVALTASNPFGPGTITKISYITITNPGTLPLVEGFQGAAWPPANWNDDNKFQDSIHYTRATNAGGFGLSTASLLFDNYYNDAAGVRDAFQLPKVNMSGVIKARLRFDIAFARYDATYTDSLQVQLSTNCGVSWNSIYFNGGTSLSTAPDFSTAAWVPASTEWRTDSIDITALAAGQGNVLMQFVNHGHYGQTMYIDNVNIVYTLTAMPAANYNYAASICTGAATTFTDVSSNTPTSWSWNMPGAVPATSTLQNPSVSYATPGVKTVTLTATNSGGSNSIVKTFTVVATPTISTGGTTSVCSGSSATITAGGATTYSWNPGGLTGSSVVVSPGSTTTYTVTGATSGCSGTSTKAVTVTPNPTVTVNTASVCGGSTATLTAAGATTYSWNTGATTAAISAAPGTTTNYTVTGTTSGCSNTQVTSITVVSAPTVAVNPATVCSGSSANLTAGGATTYSWNTGATTSNISVSPTVTTVYTATGTTGSCASSKSTTVTVNGLPTVNASSTTTLLCVGQSATLTATGATTYTWNPGGTGASIVVSPTTSTTYSLNGTDANGCTNVTTFNQVVSTCVGMNPLNTSFNGNILLMPNPNNGQFSVTADMQESFDVSVYNSIGQLIMVSNQNHNNLNVNLNDYGKGMYNVMINVNGNYKNIKVIVE
jgi:serine protease